MEKRGDVSSRKTKHFCHHDSVQQLMFSHVRLDDTRSVSTRNGRPNSVVGKRKKFIFNALVYFKPM